MEPPKPAANVNQSGSSSRPANVNQSGSSNTYKQTTSVEVNRSTTTVTHVTQVTQQKVDINQSGAITGKKDPSILKPSGPSNAAK